MEKKQGPRFPSVPITHVKPSAKYTITPSLYRLPAARREHWRETAAPRPLQCDE